MLTSPKPVLVDYSWIESPYVKAIGRYQTELEQRWIDAALAEAQVESIADIGGGWGRFGIPLSARGYRVEVYDTHAESLSLLNQRAPQMCTHLIAPDVMWPIAESSVDCVLCIAVPVVAGTPLFWAECQRVLKPGGLVIGWSHNLCSYKGLKYLLTPRAEGEYSYSYRHVRRTARQAGMRIERAMGYNWLPFGRLSNSPWVPTCAALESELGLRHLPAVSPWVLFTAARP